MACKKLKVIDHILFQLSEDEKCGFMQPKPLDAALLNPSAPRIRKSLPDVLSFISSERYLGSITDHNSQNDEKNNSNKANKYKFNISHFAPCQQVFGIMQYLAMCAKVDGVYMHFFSFAEAKEEDDGVIRRFLKNSKKKNHFDTIHVFMGFPVPADAASPIHYFAVIKYNNHYRLIESFGRKKSLSAYLRDGHWMNSKEMSKIMEAFIYIYKLREVRQISEDDLEEINQKSKLRFGI